MAKSIARGSRRLAVVAVLLTGALPCAAQSDLSPADQVKAVFLFHFASFAEWPPAAFPAPDTPLSICVLGKDPFGAFLDETLHEEEVRGHALVARRVARVEEVEACHILFISASEADRMGQIFPALAGRGILTVGDADRFARAGGVIQFYTERNRIRLRINVRAARAAGITLSSKLLRLAEIVGGE